MSRKTGQDQVDAHGGKPTAIRLTAALCKAARHSGRTYETPSGRQSPRQEILWDSEVRGFGLRLNVSGNHSWVVRFRHEGRQRLVRLEALGLLKLEAARQRARKALVKAQLGRLMVWSVCIS